MTTPDVPSTTVGGVRVPTWAAFNALRGRVTAVEAITGAQQRVIDRLLADGPNPVPPPPVTAMTKFIGSGDQHAFTGMRLTMHRTYYDVMGTNNVNPDGALAAVKADALAGRLSVISLHRGHSLSAWPQTVDTARLDAYLPALNANPNIVVVLNHEPENEPDPGGDAAMKAGFKRFWSQGRTYLKPKIPASAKWGVNLMAWTGRPGGTWADWLPPSDTFDIFALDGYSQSAPLASTVLYQGLAYAKSIGKKFMIMETGMGQSGGVQAQIQWINDHLAWMKSDPDHMGFVYWNAGSTTVATNNYRLLPNALARFGEIVNDPVFNSSTIKPV